MNVEAILRVNEARFPRPDLVVVLDVPPEEGIRRICEGRGEQNNRGFEQAGYLSEVRRIYKSLCSDPVVYEVDGLKDPDVVFAEICRLIDPVLSGRSGRRDKAATKKEWAMERDEWVAAKGDPRKFLCDLLQGIDEGTITIEEFWAGFYSGKHREVKPTEKLVTISMLIKDKNSSASDKPDDAITCSLGEDMSSG